MAGDRTLAGRRVWACFIAIVVAGALPAAAQNASFGEKAPLERMLNGDGTLNLAAGFTGTLDPAGYRMATGPGGAPRFVGATADEAVAAGPAAACDPNDGWDARFYRPGLDGPVRAIAVSGADVYVAGIFSYIGSQVVNHIAKWDGTSWSALGSGMNGDVSALAVSGSDLYAGGWFTTAGGVSTNHIARWDGTSWSALDSGFSGIVLALAVSGSDLYVGGWFATPDWWDGGGIAKWDGTSWSVLGSGGALADGVSALAVSGSDLYAAGSRVIVTGRPGRIEFVYKGYVARWDGANWLRVASEMEGGVWALAVSGSDLYAGGDFTTAGGVGANGIAKWDGTSWSALGSGTNSGAHALAVSGSDLYAGGGRERRRQVGRDELVGARLGGERLGPRTGSERQRSVHGR